MTQQPSRPALPGRDSLREEAIATPGYFSEKEAELLMAAAAGMPAHTDALEIGTYHGRSTLFGLAGLPPTCRWFSVDNFRRAAGYRDHSLTSTSERVADL